MRFAVSVLSFLILFSASLCPAQNTSKEISKEMARKAIEIFCADPLSEDAKGAGTIVVNFVEKSPDVEVNLAPKSVPWITEEPQPQYASLLLAAYVVGNAKSQLESGKAKNDSVAGVLQAIATYQMLQKQEPSLKMPEVEKLIALNNQNKLREYLEAP